jgi:hypothetical protein
MRYPQSALILLGALLVSASAYAGPADRDADAAVPVMASAATLRLPTGTQMTSMVVAHDDEQAVVATVYPRPRDPRRALLSSLDLATGVVQGYDGFLTLRVVRAGGIETNPLVKPMVGNQGAMMALKVAAAVSTVVGVESLWKRDHRVGAIVASVIANSAMAMVAHHNAKVLARLEGR